MATFRAGVGIIVVDPAGRALAIERRDKPGAWQLPQGGLEADEKPLDAAYRELGEETGLERRDVTLVAEHPGWLAYELPEAYRSKKTGLGQVQKWFLFRFEGDDKRVRLPRDGEARSWAWKPLDELARDVVEFRRGVYGEIAAWVRTQ